MIAVLHTALLCGTSAQETSSRNYEQDIREIAGVVIKKFFPIVSELLTSPELSVDCSSSLLKTFSSLRQQKAWAYRMLMSNSLVSANALEGTYVAMGGFDQCQRARVYLSDGELDFKGQYCSVIYTLPPDYFKRFIQRFHDIGELMGRKNPLTATPAEEFQTIDTRGGLCTPSSCTQEDMTFLMRSLFTIYGGNATVTACKTDDPKQLTNVHVICLAVLGLLLFLVILGTIVELIMDKRCPKRKVSPSVPLRMVLSFSAITNTWYLMRTDVKPERKPLLFIAGLKVVMAFWVVLGHSYILVQPGYFHAFYSMEYMTHQFTFELILNAFLSVTTFFFISGFLLAYLAMESRSSILKKNVCMVYISRGVQRYLRLTVPTLLLLVVGFLLPFTGSGPVEDDVYHQYITACYPRWWTTFVHIQNFDNGGEQCLPHLWYVNTDLQIFLFVAFPLTLLLLRYPKASHLVGAVLAVAFCIFTCFQIYSWDLFYGLTAGTNDMRRVTKTLFLIYCRPFTHVATYVIGIACGYAATQHRSKHVHLMLQAFLWTLSLLLMCIVMFLPMPWNMGELPDDVTNAIYGGFHRVIWSLGLCWPCYACATGRGGWLNGLFSYSFFLPLSRLTYSIYLVHVLVYCVRMIRLRTYIMADQFYQLNTALGVYCMSTVFAYVLHILIEAPVFQLEKIVFERRKEEQPTSNGTKLANGVEKSEL